MLDFTILEEWFHWGESDLFFVGIGLILAGVLLPFHKESPKRHLFRALALIGIYLLAELALSFLPRSYMSELALLFLGGGCLSIGCGRLVRWVIERFRPEKNGRQ